MSLWKVLVERMRSIILVFFFSISFVFSQYQPSNELVKEMLFYEEEYRKFPTSNRTCFNLAMVYAYTGAVEEGFDKLKRLDKSYADVVLNEMKIKIAKYPSEWRYYFKIAFG